MAGNSPYRRVLVEQDIAERTAQRWQELGRLDDAAFEARLAQIIADGESPAATRFGRLEQDDRRERLRERNRELTLDVDPPTGPAATIVVDPPWDWGDEGDVDQLGQARPNYATQPLAEIAALPLGDIAEPDAHLYLWITNRSLPKGFGLLERWGFRYVTCLTWVKPSPGIGNYYRGQTEQVLFGVRGSLPLLRQDVGTVLHAPRPGGHSAKPEEFYDLIETCSPGPWLDVYARRERPGWLTWGAEL
jgi:N6-adenosine-specific RNA methylase IME4